MDRTAWRDEVLGIPVFDTHTHLNMPGVPVPARDFWNIAHYFWFLQELQSVGYPANPEGVPEPERIERFVEAFATCRNTAWYLIVCYIFEDLYGVRLGDAESVRRADEAVRASFRQPDWPRKVIDRLAIRNIAVNHVEHAGFPHLSGVGVAVPVWGDFNRDAWIDTIYSAADQRDAGEAASHDLSGAVAGLYRDGIRGMRVDIEPVLRGGPGALPIRGASRVQIEAHLIRALLQILSEHGMFAQLFLGIVPIKPDTRMAVNDPRRITDLYPLFEQYGCDFELVVGAPLNNLDAVQPARIYPNVHLGGLWWYNFRSSTYRQAMQYRLEAVPASKCALVASDARCIEWCYGKILLVKWLLADFLYDQIAQGWLGREDALWVAQEWLHDAAARRYLP